jgi:uncharacterized protein YbaP (TraB family)
MVHKAMRPFLCLIVALSIAASTSAQAPRSFLWKVSSGPRVLYLAGSIHALPPDMYPLDAAYQRAFDAAGALVEEIDLSTAEPMSLLPILMAKGRYSDARTWEQAVPADTATQIRARLDGTMPGISTLLRPMKPWVITLMLTALTIQGAGFDATLGVDKHFFDRARAANKPVVGLETAESQLDRFDTMTEDAQAQMLRATIEDLRSADTELKEIAAAWKRGDAVTMERKMLDGIRKYPGAYSSLIVERNNNWLPQIEGCLARTTPCFVVVGAAHLVGPDGLLELLRKKGYEIQQQ